jgi:gamma-glutamyltranspeptidase/glutathione hydrolase
MNLLVCPEIHAAKAARDIFAVGGNAMDAAIAAAFVQGVTNHLLCGIGGTISLYCYDAATRTDFYINGEELIGSGAVPGEWVEELAPGRAESSGRYRLHSRANDVGYKAIMVPGFVRGCWTAHQRCGSGRLQWDDLLAPAVRLATTGFEVPPYSASFWRDFVRQEEKAQETTGAAPRWTITPDSAALMLNTNATHFDQGDWFVQPDLGTTLNRLAHAGGDDFYSGEIGGQLAADLETHASLVTGDDLRSFAVAIDEPLRGTYRGFDLAAQPYSNGSKIIELLQILDHFDLAALGHNTPSYVDVVARAMRASGSDWLRAEGQPRSSGEVIEAELVSPERARYWADRIKSGDPVAVKSGEPARGTTHLTSVDDAGNVVSLNHSIGYGGSGVVSPGLGFLLNGDIGHYNPAPGQRDSIEPGKRFLGGSSLALSRDGVPALILGAPGGTRIVTSIVQSVINEVDFGMDMRTAVTAPRFHSQDRRRIFLEPGIRESVAISLSDAGNETLWSRYQARPQAIRVRGSRLEGGSDPRDQGSGDISAYPPYISADDPAHSD